MTHPQDIVQQYSSFDAMAKTHIYGTHEIFCPKDMWVFPRIVVPQNAWFIMENPFKMDDLGVPLFLETPICHVDFCIKQFL